MEKIHILYDFKVPPSRVFDFFSEHERLSEIYPGAFKRIINSTDPTNANGIGSVRRITNFPFVIEEMITKYQYPSLIEYRIVNSALVKYHKGVMKFYSEENGISTKLDYVIEFETRVSMLGFLSKNILQSTIANALKTLSRKFEENPNF